MGRKLSLEKAIKYALTKWDYAKDSGCSMSYLIHWLEENHKDIYDLEGCCGLCERHNTKCNKCELAKLWKKDCYAPQSPYTKWVESATVESHKKWAKRIYNDLKSLLENNNG